jgi:hypothetical protein
VEKSRGSKGPHTQPPATNSAVCRRQQWKVVLELFVYITLWLCH